MKIRKEAQETADEETRGRRRSRVEKQGGIDKLQEIIHRKQEEKRRTGKGETRSRKNSKRKEIGIRKGRD